MPSPAFLAPNAAAPVIPACRWSMPQPLRGAATAANVCSPRKKGRRAAGRHVRFCTAAGTPPSFGHGVPRNQPELVDAICAGLGAAAAAAFDHALRAQVHALVPGLIPGVEDAYPYNELLLYDLVLQVAIRSAECGDGVCLLFKSAGTAAAAAKYYSKSGSFPPLPQTIAFASYSLRDAPKGGEPLVPAGALGIFVNPINSRGDPVILDVEKIVGSCAPSCRWIMFNPDFTADRSALGVAEVARRNDFLSSFVDAFYFRYLFIVSRPTLEAVEKGVLVRKFPDPWRIHRLDKLTKTYSLIAEYESLPSRQRITDAFDAPPTRVRTVEDKLGQFSVDDRSYLIALLFLAVFASVMFYYIRAIQP